MDRQPPADKTIDDAWGATRTQARGMVRLTLDGVTVEAGTDKAARFGLASKLWVEVDGPASESGLREYHLAYAELKIERYTALRATYAAMKPTAIACTNCDDDGGDLTAAQAVALCDERIAAFQAKATDQRSKTNIVGTKR